VKKGTEGGHVLFGNGGENRMKGGVGWERLSGWVGVLKGGR